MHSHTSTHTHRVYDAGPAVWEMPLFLIQPRQGIKSTLCVCDGRVCWFRQKLMTATWGGSHLSNLSCLHPPTAGFIGSVHCFPGVKHSFIRKQRKISASHRLPNFMACEKKGCLLVTTLHRFYIQFKQ